MLYKDFLKIDRGCPFCEKKDRSFVDRKNSYLTYARAPYSKYHLLVVPKRHVLSLDNLTKAEEKEIAELVHIGVHLLKKLNINDCSILVREGHNQKSVNHLHYHIIPNHRIGDLDNEGKQRRIMTETEIKKTVDVIKKMIKQ